MTIEERISQDAAPQQFGKLRIYQYEKAGRPSIAIFWGRSQKPRFWHYFKTADQRTEFLCKMMEIEGRDQARQREKAEEKKNWKNPYKVGDILYSSWGYDQTNVDFYQVTRTTAKGVYLIQIGQKEVEGTYQGDSCKVIPDPSRKGRDPEEFFRRVSTYGNHRVSIDSVANAYPYNEKDGGIFKSWWR